MWSTYIAMWKYTQNINMKESISPCVECEYKGSGRKNLKVHIMKKHDFILFQRSKCEYNTNTKGAWTFHINSRHEGLQFSCDRCYHSAFISLQLKNHHMTFHQDLRFMCDKCNANLTSKSGLASQASHNARNVNIQLKEMKN